MPFFMKILAIILAAPLIIIAAIAMAIQSPIITIITLVLLIVSFFVKDEPESESKFQPEPKKKSVKRRTGFCAILDEVNREEQAKKERDLSWSPEIMFSWDDEKYHAYLQSDKWKKIRQIVLTRDGFVCQVCGTSESLEIHHMSYENIYHEEDNNYEDLITLCKYHHGLEHI